MGHLRFASSLIFPVAGPLAEERHIARMSQSLSDDAHLESACGGQRAAVEIEMREICTNMYVETGGESDEAGI